MNPIVSPLRPVLAVRSPALSIVAQQTAALLLGPLGGRWLHTIGVARRAAELAEPLGLEADVLVAAAWLHDIGYARVAVVTGFHPLDGAGYLDGQLWPRRIAGLVAHHSGARFEATARGVARALAAYPDERGPMSDALTYADQTVGATGTRATLAERRAEMLRRHGAASWNAQVDHLRGPHLRAAAARVERRMADVKPATCDRTEDSDGATTTTPFAGDDHAARDDPRAASVASMSGGPGRVDR